MACISGGTSVTVNKDKRMISRISVMSKVPDTRAMVFINRVKALDASIKLSQVRIADVYTITGKLTDRQLAQAAEMLANPVTQEAFTDTVGQSFGFDWAVEIGFLPGVTDNIASTAHEMIRDRMGNGTSGHFKVYTSKIYFLSGKLSLDTVSQIAESLHNSLIERATLSGYRAFSNIPPAVPEVRIKNPPRTRTVNLNVPEDELERIGTSGIADRAGKRNGPLAMSLPYMHNVREYFRKLGRSPTDVELESIAQTWSEHCKHTIFADPIDELEDGLFRSYIKKATDEIRKKNGKKDFCVSVFDDNSGAIRFTRECLVTHKVETHNSPSALDPYGGSVTGIVGVNRDAIGFGLGAKPVVNVYGFCVGLPDDTEPVYRDRNLKQKMLPPRRILEGIVAGVNSGGNCSGIPTPLGFVYTDKRYKGKPLVFVGTVGLIPEKVHGRKLYVKRARPGDYIVMIGGRVGLDGIHGATFSSVALDSGSPATAVQIGDPITQKKLSDAIVKEARDMGLYTSITDNGAGGLSCSVAEMAKESGGCTVRLDRVPLKYPGLSPWQIWISESQERMTLAVPKNKWKRLSLLLKRRGVEGTVIGTFTRSGYCKVTYHGKTVMNVGMDFLHNGLPKRVLRTAFRKTDFPEPAIPGEGDITGEFVEILSRPSIAGTEFISMQYDHEVQGTSVLKPLQGRGRVNADTAVVAPITGNRKGLVLSQVLYPSYSEIDPYRMAAATIDTAVRNVIAAGADPSKIGILDNFCWCSSHDPVRLGQLKEAVRACYEYAVSYRTPFISGKDSMFNDFKGFDAKGREVRISVPPTLLISAIGITDDISDSVSLDVKFPGDLLYLVGYTDNEMGGSEYFRMLSDRKGVPAPGNRVPDVKAAENLKIYRALHACILKKLITSAVSVRHGGLAVALARTLIAGQLGADIRLRGLRGNAATDRIALFSESQGRVVISVNPVNQGKLERIFAKLPLSRIGKISGDGQILITGLSGKPVVRTDVGRISAAYKITFRDF